MSCGFCALSNVSIFFRFRSYESVVYDLFIAKSRLFKRYQRHKNEEITILVPTRSVWFSSTTSAPVTYRNLFSLDHNGIIAEPVSTVLITTPTTNSSLVKTSLIKIKLLLESCMPQHLHKRNAWLLTEIKKFSSESVRFVCRH